MKTLLEYKNYLTKYLAKKGLTFTTSSDNSYYLICNYEVHYSKFEIKLYLDKRNYNDDFFIIRYHVNRYDIKTNKRKTSTKGSFGLAVYKNLQYIKEKLDKIALEEKNKADSKRKFCTELESYYRRTFKNVTISTEQYNDRISITIFAYNNNDLVTTYKIVYFENKYYLTAKSESFGKNFETFFSVNL